MKYIIHYVHTNIKSCIIMNKLKFTYLKPIISSNYIYLTFTLMIWIQRNTIWEFQLDMALLTVPQFTLHFANDHAMIAEDEDT